MSTLVRGTRLLAITDGVSCFSRDGRTWLGTIRFTSQGIMATHPSGVTTENDEFSAALDWLKEF